MDSKIMIRWFSPWLKRGFERGIWGQMSRDVMPQQLTQEERHKLEERLYELKQEHRDLDDVIDRLLLTPDVEELQLKRFKKRKLKIKDSIARLEDALIPDILA